MNEHIVWVVQGTVKSGQKEDFLALMREMLISVETEPGTLNYEWTLGADGHSLHVYERYADEAAAFAHLGTWAKYQDRFVALVDITGFTIFSEASPKLREAVAGLSPVYMTPIGGFAK